MQNSQPLLCTLRTVPAALVLKTKNNGMKVKDSGIQVHNTDFSVPPESAEIWTDGPMTEGQQQPLTPHDLPEWLNYCRL